MIDLHFYDNVEVPHQSVLTSCTRQAAGYICQTGVTNAVTDGEPGHIEL